MNNSDNSVLLDIDCKRMLKRPSKKNLVNDVMYKLFNIENYQNYENKENINIYEIILFICGCNK